MSRLHLKLMADFWPHEKLTEVNGKSPGHTECQWKLTEDLPTVCKVDEGWQKVSQPQKMLTEGLLAAWKVDGS